MRITQQFSIQTILRQVNRSRDNITTLQRNLATGKRVNTISDDPGNIQSIMRFRDMIKRNEQYQENINSSMEFLTFASNTLADSADIMASLKELAVEGADNTGSEEFAAMAEQITELLEELVDVANTKFENRYMFGGSNVGTQPFVLAPDYSAVTPNPDGIAGALKVELGQGNIDSYNVTGQEAFLQNTDVFQTVIDLRDAFINEDALAITNLMTALDDGFDQILNASAGAGAKISRYETILSQYIAEDVQMANYLGGLEDTDLPTTVTRLQGEELALEATLHTLGKISTMSVMDFI